MALLNIIRVLRLLPLRIKVTGSINIIIIAAATSFQSLLVLTIQPFLGIFENKHYQGDEANIFATLSNMSSGAISTNASICIVFIFIALVSMILRLLAGWMNGNYTSYVGNHISIMALTNLLSKPFVIQGQKNTAHKIADIQQGQAFATGILGPLIQLLASTATIIATFLAALNVSYLATIIAFGGAVVIFVLIAYVTKNILKKDGSRIIINNRKQLQLVTESFAGFKDLALESRADLFLGEYDRSLSENRLIGVRIGFLQTAPRFLIEGIGFSALGLIGLTYIFTDNNDKLISLGVLGSLALAFQIILPSLQQCFNCWSSIRSGTSVIRLVRNMLENKVTCELNYEYKSWPKISDQKVFRERVHSAKTYADQLIISNVSFMYPENKEQEYKSNIVANPILNDINLTISNGDVVGIAGKTGSGKSTMIDIICGLTAPTHGTVIVDSVDIFENSSSRSWWLQQISYVPQSIFLSDTTILGNILLGDDRNSVDWERLRWACEVAQASEFISKLPRGFETPIGEAGVKLSGGQRQRIGLARAIYKKRAVLILDEATSALDMRTEKAIIDLITTQPSKPTIIMVAHRLTTLKQCNRFFIFENGKVSEQDSYQQLTNYFGSGTIQ